MSEKFVAFGSMVELGTNTAHGVLKRNAANTEWAQVAAKDILSEATAAIACNSQKLSSVADPVADTDAATQGWVLARVSGLVWKALVKVAADADITLTGEQTIQSISCVAGDRVLLTAQDPATENGIWVVSAGAWARATDLPAGAHASGVCAPVAQGTYADKAYMCTTDAPSDVVGTDALTFGPFPGTPVWASTVTDVSSTGSAGAAATASRGDHTHDLPYSTLATVFAEANADFLMGGAGAYKIGGLGGIEFHSGANRVIKIADNDVVRSLTVATGDSAAADSGPLTLKSGSGLTDSGDVLLVSGDASQASAPSGDVRVDVGAPGSGGTAGVLKLGDVNVSAVTLGRTGKTVSVPGALTVTEALTANGAVTLGDAAGDDITITGSLASDLTFKAAARVIKIASNDNSYSLTIKTGDAVSGSTSTGDLIFDVGTPDTVAGGKLKLGPTNAAEVWIAAASNKLAFFGVTAVVRASAYTQTYDTADKTQAALTSATLTDSTGGTPGTTLAAITGGGSGCEDATKNAIASLAAQVNALRVDLEDVKQITNALIDDLQAYGLAQ